MSWYSIFYWITVADRVKEFFDTASGMFSWFASILVIAYIILSLCYSVEISENNDKTDAAKALSSAKNVLRRLFSTAFLCAMLTWLGYVFCPSKSDALIIVAGGAVGNFITKDTSARQIPPEVMTLLRDKIRSEIKDIHVKDMVNDNLSDTLKSKTKEELIEILKKKQE